MPSNPPDAVPPLSSDDVYTMDQAAQLKGVSYHTVSRAIRRGVLPARRLGKMAFITKTDLLAWRPKYDRAPMQYRDRSPVPDARPALVDLASTDRVKLAAQLGAMIEVSEAAIRELALDKVLDLVCERMAAGMGLRRVGMWRTDRNRGTATLIASFGARVVGLLDLVDLGSDLSGVSSEPIISAIDLSQTTIVIPMRLGDRVMGQVIADRAESTVLVTGQDYEFARAIVNIGSLAIAVQEARLAAMTTVQPKSHPVPRAASA